MNSSQISYWSWFFRGSGHLPGYRRIVNRWLLLHLFAGTAVAILTPLSIKECANTVLLPLAGTLVGLSFAWAGNAQALLESEEIAKISEHHPGGFVEYVYIYQTAILTVMSVLILWGMAGLEICHQWLNPNIIRGLFLKSLLFMLSSLALRECWHVIMGAQWMLIYRREIREKKDDKDHF